MAHGAEQPSRSGRKPRALFDLRPHLVWALRVGGHVNVALAGRVAGPGRRAGLIAAGLLGDAVHRRWLERDHRHHPYLRGALDTAEVALWTLATGRSDSAAFWAQQAHVVAPALETGFRLGAGTTAIPVPVGSRSFPPRGRDAVRSVAELTATTLAPLATHVLVRRWSGWRWRAYDAFAPVFATVGPLGLARYRARMQRQAREEWWVRATVEVEREIERARASSAVRASPGHDFKKNLTVLGWSGSEACRTAAHQQAERPRLRAVGADGTTVFGAALGIPVEPADRRAVWISDDQRRVLDRFIDEVDVELETRAPLPRLDVLGVDGTTVRIRYRGRRLDLVNPPPRLEVGLDSMVPTLIVSLVWKALSATAIGHRWDRRFLSAAVALDVVTALGYERARRRAVPGRFTVTLLMTVASSVLAGIGIARSDVPDQDPSGQEQFVASFSAFSVLAMVAASHGQVDRRLRSAAALIAVVQWAVLSLPGRSRPPLMVAAEAVAGWQALIAPRGLSSHVAAEAEALERELQDELQERVRNARTEAADEELATFRSQLDLVESELARLGDAMDAELARHVAQQCVELRTWLDDPASREEMVS